MPRQYSHNALVSAIVAYLALTAPAVSASFDSGMEGYARAEYDKTLAEWRPLAEKGDAMAQYGMGFLFQFGQGVPVDLGAAANWYEKAANQHHADAAYALGLLYEMPAFGKRDLAKALDWYKKAADMEPHAKAEFAIGRMYYRARGTDRKPDEAVKWFRKSADKAYPGAEYMLGACYESGFGVPEDPAQSYYWYFRASLGDEAELQEEDRSFTPKMAMEAVHDRLPAAETKQIETRARKEREARVAAAAKK